MDERERLDPTFFSVPSSDWGQVEPEIVEDLARLQRALERSLRGLGRPAAATPADAGESADRPAPAELALRMHEVAGSLLAQVAADEQDLRQIISTLRTALAVCWDLYSVRESEGITVAEHMRQLRTRIEDFERELVEIRKLKGVGGGQPE